MNTSSHSWTTSTCWRSQVVFVTSRICWMRGCLPGLGSKSTQGRRAHGIVQEYHHRGRRSWVQASRFWVHQWGDDEFVRTLSEERISKEQHLWRAVVWVPAPQCAWQIHLQGAGPRCHHFLRTLPDWYARHHDEGMLLAMEHLLEGFATTPMRLGGLGLRSAGSCSALCVLGRRTAHDC